MTTRWVESPADLKMLLRFIDKQPLPFSIDLQRERHRTTAQNKLQRQWMNDIAAQLDGHDAEWWRGYCKLRFGVPIRKADSEVFTAFYERVIRPLPFEDKLEMMCVPMDLPVTRDMGSKQMTRYLDAVQRHFAEQGVALTDPEEPLVRVRLAAAQERGA